VTKGGNGYYTVQFVGDIPGFSHPINRLDRARAGNVVMKRSTDLKHINLGSSAPSRAYLTALAASSQVPALPYHPSQAHPHYPKSQSQSPERERPLKRSKVNASPFDDTKS